VSILKNLVESPGECEQQEDARKYRGCESNCRRSARRASRCRRQLRLFRRRFIIWRNFRLGFPGGHLSKI